MLPIVLNSKDVRIGVAGRGDGLARRLKLLSDAGVRPSSVFEGRTPAETELQQLNILFVAGLDDAGSAELAAAARAARVLVNVEDQPALCDFHVPAQVKRGDLLLTVSTGGRSPGLARALREELETRFGPEWDARLDELARLREGWRGEGAKPDEVSARTRAFLAGKGWLA